MTIFASPLLFFCFFYVFTGLIWSVYWHQCNVSDYSMKLHLNGSSKTIKTSPFFFLSTAVLLRLIAPLLSLQATGPQSSERASEARGGPVGLAQHGWRGRRWRGRGQDRHTAAPLRWPRTLLFLLVHLCTKACGGNRPLLDVVSVAEWRRSTVHRRTSASGVEHH